MARYEPTYTTTDVLGSSQADKPYHPSDVTTGTNGQKLSIYKPRHSETPNGFPTVIFVSLASFTYSSRLLNGVTADLTANSPNPVLRLMYELVREGIQCVQASVTVARGGSTGNATSTAGYDPEADEYGAAYTNGNGAWVYPGDNPFSDPTATFGEFDRPMAVQDILWIIQYLKENADANDIDVNNLFLVGASAGGFTTGFAALNADLSHWFSAGSDTQNGYSTRVKGWIPFNTPMFMPCMKSATSVGHAFPTDADVDTPAAFLDDVYPAGGTIDATNYQWKFSPMAYATEENMVHTLMVYDDATLASRSITGPLSSLEANVNTNFHDLRFGAMFRKRFPSKTQLVFAPSIGNHAALAPIADQYEGLVDHVFEQVADNETDPLTKHLVDWVLGLCGLRTATPTATSRHYGLARANEYGVIIPGAADTWTRVLRSNPGRTGPVLVQARAFGSDYPNVYDFDTLLTTNPSTLNGQAFVLASHRTSASYLVTGIGTYQTELIDPLTELNIGGAELWCKLRAGTTPGGGSGTSVGVLSVIEPTL